MEGLSPTRQEGQEDQQASSPNLELLKVLHLPQPYPNLSNQISCIEYGPYDNGYLMLGTDSGHLLVLDPLTLGRISMEHLFTGQQVRQDEDGSSPPSPV